MIFDTLDNLDQYQCTYPDVYRALKAMTVYTPDYYPTGRVDIDGDLFLLRNSYETHSAEGGLMEAHRQYLDVMLMVDGEETIYIKPVSKLQSCVQAYDTGGDALLAKIDDDATPLLLQAGSFVVLFPQDAHCPACCGPSGPMEVRKIIGKVRWKG